MSDSDTIPLKKIFLHSLIISVAISAVLGILAILLGDFGELEVKILLTTLTISAASLCGLCCGASIELRGQSVLAVSGIVVASVAAVFVIGGVWIEPNSDAYWKSTITLSIFAVALSHLSLLTLAHLNSRFKWAMPAAYGVVFAVAFLLTGMIWGEWYEEFLFRLLGVAGILDGAITILIPIFHRLSGDEAPSMVEPALAELDREIAQLENRLEELKAQRQSLEDKQPRLANTLK